jgi:hypothetical protein
MKISKRLMVAAGVAAVLAAIPMQTANAYWVGPGPGYGPWRHAYVHDPNYKWGPPTVRRYIRDLHLYGPSYAAWNQKRRYHQHWW